MSLTQSKKKSLKDKIYSTKKVESGVKKVVSKVKVALSKKKK